MIDMRKDGNRNMMMKITVMIIRTLRMINTYNLCEIDVDKVTTRKK
jgi:hypothetical protein